jgi:hypothetical protein
MLLKKNEGLRDLRKADPRSQAGFDVAVEQHAGIRDAIIASDVAPGRSSAKARSPQVLPAEPRGSGVRRARPTRRLIGLSAGATFAVAAAVVAAVLLLGGGNPNLTPSPALAAEAAKKAAVDTTAAAKSGVIETVLLIDGEAQVMNKISWNGDDLSLLVQNDKQRQIRYVDGLYYETYGYSVPIATGDSSHVDQWIHITSFDNDGTGTMAGSAIEQPAPAEWLTAARTDLAGDGLTELVSSAQGYTRAENTDGSVSYSATTTVAAIQSQDWSISGLPMANQPSFKVLDTSTPVAVVVTVGADGLIRELKLDWTLDLSGEASVWSYKTAYSQLGTAPAITAPDASRTITTDARYPATEAGPM